MDNTLSMSEACFAFKGKTRTSPRKSNSRHSRPSTAKGQTTLEISDKQYAAYKDAWKSVETEIHSVQTQVVSDVAEAVVNHIRTLNLLNGKQRMKKDIPTVALMTGVNTSDHGIIFTTLLTLLEKSKFEHVAYIKSQDCVNIKSLIHRVVEKLINSFSPEDEQCSDFDSDESEPEDATESKSHHWTISNLAAGFEMWLKNNKLQIGNEKLIVIIDNIESFAPSVLEDFVAICSEYSDDLPWVFVFGVPTSLYKTSFQRLLPQSASKVLSIEKFHAPLASHVLGQVVSKVLMTEKFPFKLGLKCYQLLEEIFLYHDLSVSGFQRRMQFCMMEHFTSNFVSVLCCPQSELKAKIKNLNSEELEKFRRLKSFMLYVESCPPDQQTSLLLNDDHFKTCLLEKMVALHDYHKHYFPVLLCLHKLTYSLPNTPLGSLPRELYSQNLAKSLDENPGYKTAMKLLGLLSKDELITMLKNSIDAFREQSETEELTNFRSCLESFLCKLVTLEEFPSPKKRKSPVKNLQQNRSQFLETLRGNKKETLNHYERLRKEILDYVDRYFQKHLVSYTMYAFHEVLYFNDIGVVKRQLMPIPRSAIHSALNNPYSYLKCKCCAIEEQDTIRSTMPDICIIYKLHLESGRMLNLYDLLQAFATIVEPQSSNGKTNNNITKTVQARFAKCVSELQYLGFVNSTRKKADHLVRLTWGDC